MKHIKAFEDFAEQQNCTGCGAGIDYKKDRCDFCGKPYKVTEEPKPDNSKTLKDEPIVSRGNRKKKYFDDFQKRTGGDNGPG